MMTIVPAEMLSTEAEEFVSREGTDYALRQIVLEFVSREGTDYGHSDWTLDQKADQVLAQITRGEVVVTYDDLLETCNLAKREDAQRELERLERLATP